MYEMKKSDADIAKPLDDGIIEGEFKAEQGSFGQASGFYCKRCQFPIKVGEHRCESCEWVFGLTTPPLAFVKALSPDKQWTFYADRIDGEELARSQQRNKKRR